MAIKFSQFLPGGSPQINDIIVGLRGSQNFQFSLSSPLTLQIGGIGASLTPSVGGIFYSTSSSGAILPGTPTANQIILSGASAAPSWSTATYPATTAINQLLYSSANNVISGLATASNSVLVTDSLGVPSIGTVLPLIVQNNITQLGVITSGVWTGTVIGMASGGTNASLVASNGGIIYSNASSMQVLAGTLTANQILLSGSSSSPSWSTATYPATTTINQLLYSSAANNITGLSTSNSALLATSSGGAPTWLGPLTNGQVIIGSTGGIPVAATLTQGSGVSIVNGAGTITISATGSGGTVTSLTAGTGITLTPSTITTTGSISLTTPVSSANGGTGVANAVGSTITLGGALTFSGAFATTINVTNTTNVTLPTSGTLVNTAVTTLSSLVIAESQVTNLTTDLASKVPLSGGTMTGLLILSGDPTVALGTCTKQYADAIAAGLYIKGACYAASTTQLTATYNNGSSGVGATLTNSGTQAVFAIDSLTPPVNSRILIKDQSSNTFQNGAYILTNVGSPSTNWVLTRATDYDTISEIHAGDLIVIDNGSVNGGTGWLQTQTVTTIGTSAITFTAFNLMQTGTGLTRIGNTISLTNPVSATLGGTGVANLSGSTITLGGALTFSGAFTTAFTVTGNTAVTLPTSGTLLSSANNLSDVSNAATAAHNLGLGTTDSPTFAGLTLLGTVTINNSGSAAINIGKGTYTGASQLGGNTIDITANSTGSVSIGNALNTIYIGSQGGANSIVNIQSGTGSNATNICASGYKGILTQGNVSSNVGSLIAHYGLFTYGSSTYNTGTVSASASTTITGSGTTFTSAMSGGVLLVTSGANIGTQVGVTFVSGTSLTADQAVTIAAGSSYIIYYGAIQFSPATYNIGSGAFAGKINIGNGTGASTINIGNSNSIININHALEFAATTTAPTTGIYNLTGTGMVVTCDNFEIFTNLASPTVTFLVDNTNRVLTKNQTLDDGGGGFQLAHIGSNAASIAGSTYSGTLTLGNASSTITIAGALNINTSGTASVNIGTGSYNGVITIGNSGNTHPVLFAQEVVGPSNVFDNGVNGASSWAGRMSVQGTAQADQATTGAMYFQASSLSIGKAASSIVGTATELNFGTSYAQRMICLFDAGSIGSQDQNQYYGLGITSGALHYSIGGTSAFHKFYAGVNSSTSNLLFTIAGNGAVTSVNNTLDDGTGRLLVNYSSGNAGIVVTQNTSGNRCDTRFSNSPDSTGAIIGLDGFGGLNADPGSLLIQTTTTKPIYLSPGGTSLWALKLDSSANSTFGGSVWSKGEVWGNFQVTTVSTTQSPLSSAAMTKGIIVVTGSGGITLNFDNGTNVYTSAGGSSVPGTNQCRPMMIVNQSSGTVTIGAAPTGGTLTLSKTTIAAGTTANYIINITGVNTYTIYGGN